MYLHGLRVLLTSHDIPLVNNTVSLDGECSYNNAVLNRYLIKMTHNLLRNSEPRSPDPRDFLVLTSALQTHPLTSQGWRSESPRHARLSAPLWASGGTSAPDPDLDRVTSTVTSSVAPPASASSCCPGSRRSSQSRWGPQVSAGEFRPSLPLSE